MFEQVLDQSQRNQSRWVGTGETTHITAELATASDVFEIARVARQADIPFVPSQVEKYVHTASLIRSDQPEHANPRH